MRTAVHAIQAEHVAMFLGHKLTGRFQHELGHDFSTRIQGTRIHHHMGPASLKLYDKAGLIARVECTANDVSFFKHHHYVEQRNGEPLFKRAPLRESIYSLTDLRQLLQAATRPTWPSWPVSITPMPRKRRSPRCPSRPRRRAALFAASTSSSIPTTASARVSVQTLRH